MEATRVHLKWQDGSVQNPLQRHLSVDNAWTLSDVVTRTLIDWLINCKLFIIMFENILLEDVTLASEGLQNLGLYSELMTYEQGGIFIVPYLL